MALVAGLRLGKRFFDCPFGFAYSSANFARVYFLPLWRSTPLFQTPIFTAFDFPDA